MHETGSGLHGDFNLHKALAVACLQGLGEAEGPTAPAAGASLEASWLLVPALCPLVIWISEEEGAEMLAGG